MVKQSDKISPQEEKEFPGNSETHEKFHGKTYWKEF